MRPECLLVKEYLVVAAKLVAGKLPEHEAKLDLKVGCMLARSRPPASNHRPLDGAGIHECPYLLPVGKLCIDFKRLACRVIIPQIFQII